MDVAALAARRNVLDDARCHHRCGGSPMTVALSDEMWARLAHQAWQARTNAYLHGPTAVGCAVLSGTGSIFAGCNVEHRFRSHDVHAETNALTSMVTAEGQNDRSLAVAVLIVSARKQFTPCGACLDWIFELGAPETLVAHLGEGWPVKDAQIYRADELMPAYPC